ncbi:MAG: hypothetical protein O7H40_08385, partial [Gammaproteobacteria bacterium]|nr:hypothetical protein [Gammaproteobacteria bacterium]
MTLFNRLAALAFCGVLIASVHSGQARAAGVEEFEGWLKANQDANFQFVDGDLIHYEDCEELKPFVPPGWIQAG